MRETLVPLERIRQTILLLRGQRVILDRDLAALYGVPTKVLKQAVKRNAGRFPEDFMCVLTREEFGEWRSQFVTSRADRMGLRHAPMAFTEQGIAMLSSVLNSERAIRVNIAIMRAFVRLREALSIGKGTWGTYDTYWVAIADGTGGPAVAPHRISPTSGIPELPKLPVKRGREGVKSLVE